MARQSVASILKSLEKSNTLYLERVVPLVDVIANDSSLTQKDRSRLASIAVGWLMECGVAQASTDVLNLAIQQAVR